MTTLFESVVAEVTTWPDADREAFAAWMKVEMESDRHWSQVFAQHPDILSNLADEAPADAPCVANGSVVTPTTRTHKGWSYDQPLCGKILCRAHSV